MTSGKELVISGPQVGVLSMTAKEAEAQANSIIDQFSGWATALMKVVEAKKFYAVIGEKKYLEFEAWQIIGTFANAHADTDDTTPIERNGEIVGYLCRAKIIKDGIRIGGAMQMCGLDAFPCRGKEGSAKDNAAISASQTWAASKAFKMLYSAVASLAGYSTATAEEMRRAQEEATPGTNAHFCQEHRTDWFKSSKMRNYAHPIGDTGEWCNEPSEAKKPSQGGQPAASPPVKTPAPATPGPAAPQTAPKAARVFANRGQLMEAAEAELGIGLKGVLEVLVVSRVEDIGDLDVAWARLKKSRDVGPDGPAKAAAKP